MDYFGFGEFAVLDAPGRVTEKRLPDTEGTVTLLLWHA